MFCPKCNTHNPPFKSECNMHYFETCKKLIGTKTYLWGLIKIPVYCNFIGVMDECEYWIEDRITLIK